MTNPIDGRYSHKGEYKFKGNNFINTNICLYSDENIHKNFEISFDIVKIGDGNVDHSTLLSSMDESGSPWPGHNVKVYLKNNRPVIKFESNSNTSSTGDVYFPEYVTNIRIIRINDILYYSFNGNECVKINDYTDFTDTFNVPLTFGAGLDINNNSFRYFNGTLSNMYVRFISDDTTIESFNNANKHFKTVYKHKAAYKFNGTTDYINTGLCMFTADNIDKNFEISFNIDSIDSEYENQASLINAKEEIDPYPGFVYRLYINDKTIRFDSKGGSGSGASNKQANVQKVKISRFNKRMYLSINNGEEKRVYDFTEFNNYHNIPITIGSSLDKDGNPWRFFKGTLSNIVVKVESD